ncbi:hypothetical protein VTH82DRAFT_6392 [Thermothelomyces myriococcoides]
MSGGIPEELRDNYEQFRDALSSVLVERIATPFSKTKPKRRAKRRSRKPTVSGSPPPPDGQDTDEAEPSADDLADFISYIAVPIFQCLPADLQSLAHHLWANDAALRDRYRLPLTVPRTADLLRTLDPSVTDSLAAYGFTEPSSSSSSSAAAAAEAVSDLPSTAELLTSVVSAYVEAATTPPPPPRSTKARAQEEGCEICGRDWINLSYHHLIPRKVHDKVVKRGWHREDELENVAWLCGACHRFVHRFRDHEELARNYYTVDRLLEAEEVRRWAAWVSRVRWKAK